MVAALLSYLPRAPGEVCGCGPPGVKLGRKAQNVVTPPPDVGVDAVDSDGQTPLHYAAFNGRADAVAMLLGHGAQPAVANIMGVTPLYIAASLGHEDIVDQLDPAEQPADAVSTPLHATAKYGRVGLFFFLFSTSRSCVRICWSWTRPAARRCTLLPALWTPPRCGR